jgi:hypothetical protein
MWSITQEVLVEMKQMWDHILGQNNNQTHLTRRCSICQPFHIRSRPRLTCALPVNFPSDSEYENLKEGASCIPKRLLIIQHPDVHSTTQTIKEWSFFLGTLSYEKNPKPLPTSKLFILYESYDATLRDQILLCQRCCIVVPDSLLVQYQEQIHELQFPHTILSIVLPQIEWNISLRRLHYFLLQRIGRCTMQQVMEFCQSQKNWQCFVNGSILPHMSFVY